MPFGQGRGGQGGAYGCGYGGSGMGRGRGRGAGGGQGGGGRMGGPQAAGPGGTCVCPQCGTTVPHDRGVPCAQMKCPKCGAAMARQG